MVEPFSEKSLMSEPPSFRNSHSRSTLETEARGVRAGGSRLTGRVVLVLDPLLVELEVRGFETEIAAPVVVFGRVGRGGRPHSERPREGDEDPAEAHPS